MRPIDESLIEELVDRLEERLEPIIHELMSRYREQIPSYAAAPSDFLDEVRIGTTASFQVGLQILRGAADAAGLRPPLEEVGRRRAAQGIPLGEALHAWQISAHMFWENIVDIAPEDPGTRAEVLALGARVIMELLELAVPAVSAGYMEFEHARVADEEHDFQIIVEVLAGSRSPDVAYQEAIARRGIAPDVFGYCLVGRTEGDVGAAVRDLRSRSRAVVGRIDSCVVGFFAESPEVSSRVTVAGVASVDASGRTFQHARAALDVATWIGEKFVRYEEVVPLAALMDAPGTAHESFVHAHLGPLIEDSLGPELVRSLKAYLGAGQSVAAAARELQVHRHTLEYRLDRIERLIGEGFREPKRRILLELAIALHER